MVRDFEETAKLKKFSDHLQDVENHLPMENKYKNPKIGSSSPIVVVDEILVGGERGGVQTSAFNLPNDERVVEAKGSKRVMLKNVTEAKFEKILLPIAEKLIAQDQRKFLSFDAFFTHILCHGTVFYLCLSNSEIELVHGLGPHNIYVNGKSTTVRGQLQELSSAVEVYQDLL